MTSQTIFAGCTIFDGETCREDHAMICEGGRVKAIAPVASLGDQKSLQRLEGGLIAPGFVDLQVNGGGGVLFNDAPSVEAIRTICDAHAKFGTTSVLVTLITDTPDTTITAIEAAIAAQQANVPGFLGLHLEGPHLATRRKGAHEAELIRPMGDQDLERLLSAANRLDHLMVTIAPETVTPAQVSALAEAGVIVSLGHSDATYETARAATEAGARCVTHLFNAMSPLTHREAGLVGATLNSGALYAGLIADGIHVDRAAIEIALAAKRGPGNIFLVTDAMSTIGTDLDSFTLGGRTIHRERGRLTLDDGTLAGADLNMAAAVRFMLDLEGMERMEALRMASLYPAMCMRAEDHLGRLRPGAKADFVHLDPACQIRSVWRDGVLGGEPIGF